MERQPFSVEQLREFLDCHCDLLVCPKRRSFIDRDEEPTIRLIPPPLYPIGDSIGSAGQFLEQLPSSPGLHLVLLVQAGATSMGMWRDEALLCHKVIKKYVKRGNGKAQTTYLKTRGKSRYGSRLRLQNAKAHLIETGEKLDQWWEEYGVPARIYYSCPTRLWAEVMGCGALPELPKDRLVKIGMDIRVPGHTELLKARNFLNWGHLEQAEP